MSKINAAAVRQEAEELFDSHAVGGPKKAIDLSSLLSKVDAFTQQFLPLVEGVSGSIPTVGPEAVLIEETTAEVLHLIATRFGVQPTPAPAATPPA